MRLGWFWFGWLMPCDRVDNPGCVVCAWGIEHQQTKCYWDSFFLFSTQTLPNFYFRPSVWIGSLIVISLLIRDIFKKQKWYMFIYCECRLYIWFVQYMFVVITDFVYRFYLRFSEKLQFYLKYLKIIVLLLIFKNL